MVYCSGVVDCRGGTELKALGTRCSASSAHVSRIHIFSFALISHGSQFTGKERDPESGLDFFGARYGSSNQGRFLSPDPLTGTILHIANPQRWNQYAYAVNNPLFYVDPDGRNAIAVNFQKMVLGMGHEGLISLHADGSGKYQRFGPRGFGPIGKGRVDTYSLKTKVQFGPTGLPTDASYRALASEVARLESGQDPQSVRMNYFKTTEVETLALDAQMDRLQAASDQGRAPIYDVGLQNCAACTIGGLIQGGAILPDTRISLVPNNLFWLLSMVADESYSNGKRTQPKIPQFCTSASDDLGNKVQETCHR